MNTNYIIFVWKNKNDTPTMYATTDRKTFIAKVSEVAAAGYQYYVHKRAAEAVVA